MKQPSNHANLAASIPDPLKRFLLDESHNSCAICKKAVGTLDIHHMKPRSEGGLTTYPNLIVLCPTCHRIAHKYSISARSLKRIKSTWAQYCKEHHDAYYHCRQDADQAVSEARRLSLSLNPEDLIRAKAMLEMLLSHVDPLNVDGAILLRKVSGAVKGIGVPDEIAYSTASQVVVPIGILLWIIILSAYVVSTRSATAVVLLLATPLVLILHVLLTFLVAVLPHELGHAGALYAFFRKQVPGCRISFWLALRHIHWNTREFLSMRGLLNALKGQFKGVWINLTELQDEWWNEVVGREDLRQLHEALATEGVDEGICERPKTGDPHV